GRRCSVLPEVHVERSPSCGDAEEDAPAVVFALERRLRVLRERPVEVRDDVRGLTTGRGGRAAELEQLVREVGYVRRLRNTWRGIEGQARGVLRVLPVVRALAVPAVDATGPAIAKLPRGTEQEFIDRPRRHVWHE